MQFAVGYQLAEPDEESFVEIVREFRAHVPEVYFAWPGHASGRSPIGVGADGCVDPEAQERFEADLIALREMGVRLDVLFNANCYGGAAQSLALEREVGRVLERLLCLSGGEAVATTTSPAIAHKIKKRFPSVRTRASVNMRIGTVAGMQYLAELFDGFHVQREHNRNLAYLRELRTWADAHGKELHLLANSGCLWHCSGQTFHDNLVAHETEVSQCDNLPDFMPYTCWNYLRDKVHWPSILQATWIRPEDLHHYDGLFGVVKLATRLHERPHAVLRAYATRKFAGNLLDLFEPGYSPAFAPYAIDNERFPSDWFERTSTCDRCCDRCGYCRAVLHQVLVDTSHDERRRRYGER
jgi:hypothetical protein